LVAIDEVQYLSETEFSALIVAIHRISQLRFRWSWSLLGFRKYRALQAPLRPRYANIR